MMIAIPVQVNAASAVPDQDVKTCVDIIEHDYTTDIDELLDLVVSQRGLLRSIPALPDGELTVQVQQLVKKTIYSDGSIEKQYASSNITLFEDSRIRSRDSEDVSLPKYWGKYDIACTLTAYYTSYWGTETGRSLNYITFTFNDAGSDPRYIRKVEMATHGIMGPTEPQIERYATYTYPNSGYSYRLNSDDSRIYDGSGLQALYCGAIVTFSNGTVSDNYDLAIILV